MKVLLFVALGGAIGAVARYGVSVGVGRWLGTGFPWGTFIVNVAGSFILGALIELMALRLSLSQEWRALLTVGVMGAFTTFSTFSMDSVVLVERKEHALAILYVAGSVVLALAAFFAGLRGARLVLS